MLYSSALVLVATHEKLSLEEAAGQAALQAFEEALGKLAKPLILSRNDRVQVLRVSQQIPVFQIHGPLKKKLGRLNLRPLLSLSHDAGYGAAFVVLAPS